MKHEKKKELKEKGWSEREILHAEEELEKAVGHDVHFAKIVFWSALIVIVFANFLVSVVLIPFLLAFNPWYLYGVVVVFGGMIGFLYRFLVNDIGHLEKKHHIWAGILVPIIALANMAIMILVGNRYATDLNIQTQNPWLVAGVFAVAFILPYLVGKIFERK